ncbi:PAS domain-containing sensor histidine kinase [Bhargavaea cecembensis]|uniref:histidine kinase n=1 Tax=Bhargavaea cecembensis TaxID=394098 RepID=A0A165GT25_9BACL|nr:cell wall metabolism sensor histidine kinase WalK [Bhargavaea cecembensis]KZE37555.1 PAS domain-containing sensor histidine kinase [Bhargavaea cecembensis]
MRKVGFFRSIHLKFVLMYVLLILIAMQIIGIYFAQELEKTLKENFQASIEDRVNILEFSIREEMTRLRTEEDPSIEVSLGTVLSQFSSDDIIEVRIIDPKTQILATSEYENQHLVNQRTMDELVRKSIQSSTSFESTFLNESQRRIWVLAKPIISGGEVIAVLHIQSNIEKVYSQINEINQILAGGTAFSLGITVILGILIAQTITRPIADMTKQASAMAKGNFARKVRVYGQDEIGDLAKAFNHLTTRLQEAQSSTESERRKLASVLSNMTDGVISTDRKGRIILINDTALGMLGIPREHVLNRPVPAVLGLEQDHTFEDLVDMQGPVTIDFSDEDRPYILRANFSVIQKETGFVNGLIVVLHDITEQEKIEMERREFVSNVSHELRTPLTSMRSYLEALADGAWKDEEIAPSFLHVTQTETERMIRLVTDLLQLSRMDSREYELNTDIVDFVKFFHRIIDRFELMKSKDVELIRLIPPGPLYTELDMDKMTQVIDNIISNALKYSPDGGNVRFTVQAEDDHIKIAVADEGMGIPEANVNRIFERFYRADKARSRAMGGTGLGLAIAKEMIQAHGGLIWAESEEGKGTTIFFTLPFEVVEAGEWD